MTKVNFIGWAFVMAAMALVFSGMAMITTIFIEDIAIQLACFVGFGASVAVSSALLLYTFVLYKKFKHKV